MRTKIHIFKIVAQQLNFSKAAELLHLSQPAVSKAIKNLEEDFKTTFFIRSKNAIRLTSEGKSFLVYANKLLETYAEMDEVFTHKSDSFPEVMNLGVSTTLLNYVIPPIIAKFNQLYPNTQFNIIGGNTDKIHSLVLNQEIDFAITEGTNNTPKLNFNKFIKDEIVLITRSNNMQFKNGVITIDQLQSIPIVCRENGSGTRAIIDKFLIKNNITSLNRVLTFSSSEAIKNYLYNSDNFALLSIHAVLNDLNDNRLKIIDIKNLSIDRWFYFVKRTGYLSQSTSLLEEFIRTNYRNS